MADIEKPQEPEVLAETEDSSRNCLASCLLGECAQDTKKTHVGIALDASYVQKWAGASCFGPPRAARPPRLLWSFVGSFLGISVVALLSQFVFDPLALPLLYGSFGATAVLLYAAPASPLAQPRNLLGGHTMSAVIGVCLFKLSIVIAPSGILWWLAAALAVSVSIVVMHVTKTLHPPGGATAMIAVISVPVQNMGFLFIPFVSMGAVIMMLIALTIDNLPKGQRYPQYWW